MQVGSQVKVKQFPEGHEQFRCSGKHGEVERVEGTRVLVDDQLFNGKRLGSITMREWFNLDELEPAVIARMPQW